MDGIEQLLSIMRRLRDPVSGCAWDRAQTFATIAPYTVEEAYEVLDAIERGDVRDIKQELGDLLLQVVFHSQIAEEAGLFDFNEVATGIAEKMKRRHPHIFGQAEGVMDMARWEEIKAAERRQNGATSAMDDVARALPALLRAEKLQHRAARDGFDWPDTGGSWDKLREELDEFAQAEQGDDKNHLVEEAGDVLFAMVNVLRARGINAEQALKAASDKFARRYRLMEELADRSFADLSLAQQEALWARAKKHLT